MAGFVETDVLVRLGGDEFAIILTKADLAQAQVVAADIVRMVGKRVPSSGNRRSR